MEKIVYLREAASLPTVEEQQALLRKAGVRAVNPASDRAYLDEAPRKRGKGRPEFSERPNALRAIRAGAGDTFCVAVAAVLAVSVEDALPVLEAIAKRGASIFIASDGLTVGPQDGPGMIRLAQRIASEAAEFRTRKARAGAARAAKLGNDARRAAWALAAELWPQAEISVATIKARTGIGVSTLYRAQRDGLLPAREAQPLSARLALANAARAAKKRKVAR
jgi:DNA invertase Pin-like site-specific DNA recombinase